MPDVGSDPVDRLLADAGARWRDGQPSPAPVGAGLFAGDRAPRFELGFRSNAWSFAAGAASVAALVVGVAVAAPGLIRIGAGSAEVPATGGFIATGLDNCPLTRPTEGFNPDTPQDPGFGHGWYGTDELYTALPSTGADWRSLPRSESGYSQKTFWWREGYRPGREPMPEIYVTGRRLDGPGSFGYGPGTNASWDGGSAMLVGIDVPTTGCWELTGRYYTHKLSYVAWVDE